MSDGDELKWLITPHEDCSSQPSASITIWQAVLKARSRESFLKQSTIGYRCGFVLRFHKNPLRSISKQGRAIINYIRQYK